MSASVAASVVGLTVGVNALTGNPLGLGGSSGGGGGSSGGGSGQYYPYGQYRGQAATQLNTLMNNPSMAMSQPGYQQQLQQGMRTTQRGAAATGMLQSGAEQNALQNVGQNTFGSFYNSQLANLMQLSGASQSPAAAGMAQQQAASLAQNRQFQGINQATSALGAMGNLFGGTTQTQPFGYSGMSSGMSGGYTGNVYDASGNLSSSGNAAPAAADWASAFGGTTGMGG